MDALSGAELEKAFRQELLEEVPRTARECLDYIQKLRYEVPKYLGIVLLGAILAVSLSFSLVELINLMWPTMGIYAFAVYALLSCIFGLRILRWQATILKMDRFSRLDSRTKHMIDLSLDWKMNVYVELFQLFAWPAGRVPTLIVNLIGSAAAALAFVLGSSEFFRLWGSSHGGFSVAGGDLWMWIHYTGSWLLDTIMANGGQIFGWTNGPVKPIQSITQVFVWAYNIALNIILIGALFRAVQGLITVRQRQADATVREVELRYRKLRDSKRHHQEQEALSWISGIIVAQQERLIKTLVEASERRRSKSLNPGRSPDTGSAQ